MPSDQRPVLVLGATGTTGRRLVRELRERGATVRAASRHPGHADAAGVTAVRFDWDDPATHDAALAGAGAAYLMAPPADPAPIERMGPFVQRAVAAGVGRLVLLSSSGVDADTPGLGEVHRLIAGSGAGWAALRPSWFMQNLWNPTHPIGAAVRAGGEIVTATGDGRVAFVDATDIARVAARALSDPTAPDRDLIITGPEALSYDQVAATLTDALGRPVRHRAVGADAQLEALTRAGVPPAFAGLLVELDVAIAGGAEDRVTDVVRDVTGAPPRSLATVLAEDTPYEQELA